MVYSESLANRIRHALATCRHVQEKKMFGGVGFMLHGNMVVAVWNDSLIVRVGPDAYAAALREPEVRPFDLTGRPMNGWVLVSADGIDSDQQLSSWIDRALAFVRTLPTK